MTNFEGAQRAVTLAINSAGSATKENEAYMDSMSAKLNLLKAQFQELVLGEGGLQNAAKWFLDLGVNILKFANSDIGQLIIQLGLLATAFSVVTKAILTFSATNFGTSIGLIVTEIGAFIAGASNMTNVITALTISMESCPLFWGALAVTGIVLIVKAIDSVTVSLEEQIEKLNEAKSAYEDAQGSVESLESQLDTIDSKIKEINSQDGAKVAREGELNELNRQKAELESMLEIEKERLRIAQLQYEQEAKKTVYKDVVKTKTVDSAYGGQEEVSYVAGDRAQILKDNAQAMLEYQQVINETNPVIDALNDKLNRNGELSEYEQQQLDEATSKRDAALGSYNELSAESTEYATQLQDEIALLSEDSEVRQYVMEGINAYAEALKANSEAQEESLDANEKLNESLSELTDEQRDSVDDLLEKHEELSEHLQEIVDRMIETGCSAEEAAEQLEYITDGADDAAKAEERLSEATSELNSALDALNGMASAYDTLSNAVNEYNATGQFSLSTLADLTALGSDYMGLLELENGQMTINEQGLRNLANAYIDDAEAKAYDKAMAELETEAQDKSNSTHQAGLSAGNSSASGSITAANGARIAAQEAINGADAWNLYWSSVTNGKYKNVSKTKLSNVGKSLQTQLSALESFRKSVGKNTVSAIKNTKATGGSSKARGGNSKATKANTKAVDDNTKALKANVDALKEQKEALEKEVDDYKKVIDYLNDKVDEEIDKLEEARDAEVQAIEDRIDEYEKLADAQEESIDNEIDKLKEAKDAEEEYWNAQIDELEKANDAMEEQAKLEQLLQNLENARRKKVKVYREGKGFVYETDQDEVAKAKKELEDYQNQKALEDQINLLKKNRDDALSVYDKQIADLEDYKKRQKAKYDAIIEDLKKQVEQIKAKYDVPINALKEWKETFKKQTEAYEQEIARQLTIQKTGIDTESANWTTRLNNLDAFVSAYNAKLKELDDVTSKLESAEKAYNQAQQSASSYDYDDSGDGGGGDYGGGGGGGSSEPSAPKTGNYKVLKFEKKFSNKTNAQKYIESLPVSQRGQYAFLEHGGAYYVYKKSNYNSYQGITASQAANYAEAYRGSAMYWAYASGAAKIGSNQMALVGDDPKYRELVIGSKLNGIAMQLSKGSGVVNAKSTNTFAGLLNALGSALNDGSAKGSILNNNSDNSSSMYIDKVVIEGSHITDIVSFKNSLMNLKSEATQRAYKHK